MKTKPSASIYLFGLWVLFEYSTRYTALRVYRLVFFGFENWTSIGTVRLIDIFKKEKDFYCKPVPHVV